MKLINIINQKILLIISFSKFFYIGRSKRKSILFKLFSNLFKKAEYAIIIGGSWNKFLIEQQIS